MTTATPWLSAADLLGVTQTKAATSQWQPYPHQVPPDWDWWLWMLLGGRGCGKTESGSRYTLSHLETLGPRARVGVGAPTIGSARDVCAEGETGLITIAPSAFRYNRSLGEAWHTRGGYVKFLGSEEPARWNGPQWTMLWADELALWNKDSWDQAQFGVRLGADPRIIVTTTPKARKFVKALMTQTGVAVTNATTWDNPALAKVVVDRLTERYGGTRLGKQELGGEFVDDVEGALWQRAWIEDNRVMEAPQLTRVVVPVDPAGTHDPKSDETGIAVVGRGEDGDYYVLHCLGYRLSPAGWADKAIWLFDKFEADRLLGERNNGGDMVEYTIRTRRRDVPLKTIHASRGKAVRAEPVAALYEQGKIHHVGVHAAAEDQMCSFPVENENDDMVDALVYGVSELMENQSVLRARFID